MQTFTQTLTLFRFALVGFGLWAAAGCAAPPGPGAPGGVADVAAPDDEGLAAQAVANSPGQQLALDVEALLVGPQSACQNCHTITRQTVRDWAEAMLAVEAACVMPLGLTPLQRVDCLRLDPSSGASPFSAHKLGLYAAGASGAQFAKLFAGAFGAAEGAAQHAAFVQKVGMPLGGPALSPTDFAKIKGWVLRGTPAIDEVFDDGINPDPSCDETTAAPELLQHIARMKTEGWGARLAELATPMFGCGGATNPLDCLASFGDMTATYGEPAAPQTLRFLRKQGLVSHYWVRSSADGRYVGFGLNTAGRIVDLSKPDKPIAVAALYDPYFFPSNDGFAFAGVGADFAIRACRQSLIADAAALPTPAISMLEPKCSPVAAAIYQSVGSSLDGVRYFMTLSANVNDDAGYFQTTPLPTPFGQNTETTFIPMENDGQAYQVGAPASVATPGEGDVILSPSTLLASARFQRTNGQSAYRVRLVKAQGAGAGLSIEAPLVAQVCAPGAKASFSFDERFLVTHQYVDHADPDQASLPLGSSNIVLVDLKTGKKTRLTKMPAGSFAFSPHFRADGWLYFMVRDMKVGQELLLASDAALRAPE
ncbi:MAG TPA: hypothetical protein VFS43_16330 [Polyangiaceae bacterium]|nr:hypothetical protein [Polyangiaceae bacterium]